MTLPGNKGTIKTDQERKPYFLNIDSYTVEYFQIRVFQVEATFLGILLGAHL